MTTSYPTPPATGYPVTDYRTRDLTAGPVTLTLSEGEGTATVLVSGTTVFYGTPDQAIRFIGDLLEAADTLRDYIEAEAQGRG